MIEMPRHLERQVLDPEKAHTQEEKEGSLQTEAIWMGGLISCGGSIEINPVIENNTPKAIARINFPDNDYKKVSALLAHFNGRIYEHIQSKYNWTWSLEASNGIWKHVDAMLPYLPSYSNHLEFDKTWHQMTDLERYKKSVQLAHQTNNETVTRSAETLLPLMDKPQFVAGMLDARANFFTGYRNNSQIPSLEICSDNEALLDALHIQHGGKLQERKSQHNQNKKILSMWYPEAKVLYEFARPHLILRGERADQVFL